MSEPTAAPAVSKKSALTPTAKTWARDQFAHALHALQHGVDGHVPEGVEKLPERGAALFVAHLIVSLGRDKAAGLSKAKVLDEAKAMRLAQPILWSAVDACDIVRFIYFANMGDVPHGDEQEYFRLVFELTTAPKPPPSAD